MDYFRGGCPWSGYFKAVALEFCNPGEWLSRVIVDLGDCCPGEWLS